MIRGCALAILLLTAIDSVSAQSVHRADDLRAQITASLSTTADGSNGKCGTAFRMAWLAEYRSEPGDVAGVWEDRPARQVSRLSPAGHFRLHFDTVGIHEAGLLSVGGTRIGGTASAFADSALLYLDNAWEQIVTVLGYDPPPADTAGGDAAYDVYVSNLPADWFGQTVFESMVPGIWPNERWQTFLEIDNDFAGMRTPGMSGLRVTVAHEFFHAVQVGAYGVWTADEFYFYELTSVWMETVIEPSIEDYLFDLPLYFASFSGKSLTTTSPAYRGYERSVFALFMEERYDRQLLREAWSDLRQRRVVAALDAAFAARGTTLRDAFREFAIWNHRTSDRAAGERTYQRANRFPRMMPAVTRAWSPPSIMVASSAEPLSHITFDIRTPSDTLSSLVINADVDAAMHDLLVAQSVGVRISNALPAEGGQRIGDLWITTEVESPQDWYGEIFSAATRGELPPNDVRPWPSPWMLSEHADLVLPVGSLRAPGSVEFISMGRGAVPADGWSLESQRAMTVARVPVSTMRDRLSSGVYVVVLREGSEQTMWKVAVIR